MHSMHFLFSKVLIGLVVIFFKMTFPKAVCIFFPALIALIEFFPCKLVWNEGLNNLPAEGEAVL